MLIQSETDAIKLLFETTHLMIPVVTGTMGLYFGSVGFLWQRRPHDIQSRLYFAGTPVVLLILSLGFWSGTLPCCIRATLSADVALFYIGQYCAQAAHLLFFFGILVAAFFFLAVFRRANPHALA